MSAPIKYLGVTEPVSVAAPSHIDQKRTAELETFLEQRNRFETLADKQHRETVLATLSGILNLWVKNVSLNMDPPVTDPAAHRAHLFSFGSYRLGVNARDADIDTVAVLPVHIDSTRDFFGEEPPETPDSGNKWHNEDKKQCVLQEVLLRDPRVSDLVTVSSGDFPVTQCLSSRAVRLPL